MEKINNIKKLSEWPDRFNNWIERKKILRYIISLFIVKVYIKVGNLWKNTKTETRSRMIFFFIRNLHFTFRTLRFGQNIALLCWLYIPHRKHNTKQNMEENRKPETCMQNNRTWSINFALKKNFGVEKPFESRLTFWNSCFGFKHSKVTNIHQA